VRRHLALDELKEKRESSAKRKISTQSDLTDPSQFPENATNNKMDVLKSQLNDDYSSSDDKVCIFS